MTSIRDQDSDLESFLKRLFTTAHLSAQTQRFFLVSASVVARWLAQVLSSHMMFPRMRLSLETRRALAVT
jgi:hypothetical protein